MSLMSVDDAPLETPADGAALAGALARLTATGGRALLRGGGTKPALGAAAGAVDVVLSTACLDAIDVVDADEGVAHAGAGVRLARLREAVHAAGWEIALDPASDAATLGGVLAAGEVGPRLRGFGRPRDVVLGLEVALATGERTRCGGRVVKNVTGYDLAKLYCGSLGTLGAIEGAWLRLHKRPETAQTLVAELPDPAAALAFERAAADLAAVRAVVTLDAATSHRLAPHAVREGRHAVVVELAGPEALVAAQARRLAKQAPAANLAREAAGAGEALARLRAWHEEANRGDDLGVRIACRPSRVGAVLAVLAHGGASAVAQAHAGLVFARLPLGHADTTDALRSAQAVLAEAKRVGEGALRYEGGPAWARLASGTVGPDPATGALSRAIALRFDAAGVLAPERVVSGATAS